MSSYYWLHCAKHEVHSDPDYDLNGSSGWHAALWSAEAGWLAGEACKLKSGEHMIEITCWGRHVYGLILFAHEHARCGVTIMRDQGGGGSPEGQPITPRGTPP